MKLCHSIVLASAVLAFAPAAMAGEDAGKNCMNLQYQFDKQVVSASAEQIGQAQSLREQGGQLCAEGKNDEGAAKIKEALMLIQDSAAPKTS